MNIINFRISIWLGMLLSLLCVACNNDAYHQVAFDKVDTRPSIIKKTAWRGKIIDITSTLAKGGDSSWKVDVLPIDSHDDFSEIHFLDQDHGWMAGAHALYKTTDGGKIWERVDVALPQRALMSNVFFVSPLIGWVAAHQCRPDQSCNEDYLWLMQTDDGGQTWRLQYESNKSMANSVRFVDNQNGWLIGTKDKNVGNPAPLILHTSDQGRHWIDVSEGLNLILGEDKDVLRSPAKDQAVEMIPESSLALTVATSRMRIFRTVDGGQNWNQIAFLRDEPEQTNIRRFGISNDKYFVAGGARSEEGVWGMLAREQKNDSWIRYRLPGVFFMDVLLLQENQILACGSIPNHGESQSRSRQIDGVILYSSDGGKNWTIIYRNPQIRSVNKIATSPSGYIWAVGNDGLILKLESVSRKGSFYTTGQRQNCEQEDNSDEDS